MQIHSAMMMLLIPCFACCALPGDAKGQEPAELEHLIPSRTALIIEVNHFEQILEQVQESGLWKKVRVVPAVSSWLSGKQFSPLSKLRIILERETGQPIREFLGDLASERFLIVARRSVREDDPEGVDVALILQPSKEKTIETLYQLHAASQRTEPHFEFLKEFVVIASSHEVLDEITTRLEDHQRKVGISEPAQLSLKPLTGDFTGIRIAVDVSHWLEERPWSDEPVVKLLEEAYRQVDVDILFRGGLTMLVEFQKRGEKDKEVDSVRFQALKFKQQADVVLTMQGRTCPSSLAKLLANLVEEKDRQDLAQLKQVAVLFCGEDATEMMELMNRNWTWSLSMALNQAEVIDRPVRTIDATWSVELPEVSPKLLARIEHLASGVVQGSAIAVFGERQLTPEVHLIADESQNRRGMWLDSIWGLTPGYVITDNKLTVSTQVAGLETSNLVIEPEHDLEIILLPRRVKEFVEERMERARKENHLRAEVRQTVTYQTLVSLFDIFAQVQVVSDDLPGSVRLTVAGAIETANSPSE